MLKIALTGNIASGKTYLQGYFEEAGFCSLCLDKAVDKIYQENVFFQEKLIEFFGTSDKKAIAKIVFNDFEKLKKLQNLIYPILKDDMNAFFDLNKDKNAVIVAAAVLFESGFDKYFDKIIFVSSKEDIRLQRLMQRDNLSEIEARKRLKSQMDEEEKIKKSDYIIYNNWTFDEIFKKNKETIKEINTLL